MIYMNPKRIFKGIIPTDLEQALAMLDVLMQYDEYDIRDRWDEEADWINNSHGTWGRWMRNHWGLWIERGPLYEYFQSRGLAHPDDMTDLILGSYWRMKKKRPLETDTVITQILECEYPSYKNSL